MFQRLISYLFPAFRQSEPPSPLRRVVTGHDEEGRGVVKSNSLIPGEVGTLLHTTYILNSYDVAVNSGLQ